MVLDRIALILVIIGALNWGIIGLFGLVRLPAVQGENARGSGGLIGPRKGETASALNPARRGSGGPDFDICGGGAAAPPPAFDGRAGGLVRRRRGRVGIS